jgi:nucleoid-associated protein YgaU
MLSQEPRASQQLEGQMRQPDDYSNTSSQQEDEEDEPAIVFSQQAPGSPAARYVAAPPALLPMAAPPPRPAAAAAAAAAARSAVADAPEATLAAGTADEAEPAAGAGSPGAAGAAAAAAPSHAAEWGGLRVSMAALRASTPAPESEMVIEQVATSLEGALVAQELGACMTSLGLSAPEGVLVDEALLALARRLITVDCSFRLATEFIKGAVLPRIASLAATASRPLLAMCQLVTSVQPKAAQVNLLLPLLCDHNMGSAQAELGATLAHVSYLLLSLFSRFSHVSPFFAQSAAGDQGRWKGWCGASTAGAGTGGRSPA